MSYCQSYRKDNLSYQKYMLKTVKAQYSPEDLSKLISKVDPTPQPITHITPTCQLQSNTCTVDKCVEWSKDPLQWGPHLWMYMHFAAANYPEQPTERDVQEMINWLCSLPVTIPCDSCRTHFRRYIEKSKPRLPEICSDKERLFNFLVDIHNKVNERNQKPIMSYEEAKQIYQ